MSPLERLEREAEERFGQATAIEIGKLSGGGWFGKIWNAKGDVIVASWQLGAETRTKAGIIRALRDYVKGAYEEAAS